ncbi:MAG: substrate-binding domain-containing protein [Litorilinea sp.]
MAKNKLTRRSFLQLSGGVVGMTALAACAAPVQAPAEGADTGSDSSEPVSTAPGELWVLHKQDYHPAYNDYVRARIVDFAAENNLELEVAFTSGFSGTGADVQKVAAAVQAGDPPDVWIDNVAPFRLDQLGLIQDVSDIQQEVIDMYGEPAPMPKSANFRDGRYVGVILHTRSDGGWARQDLFEGAGIDINALTTFEELRDACLAVSDPANQIYGWGMTINRSGDAGYLINRVVHGWGATYTDETGEAVTIDSPEMVDAVQWLVDTYTDPQWEPMMPPGILSWTDTSNNENYLGGNVAYTMNAGTVYASAVVEGLDVADTTTYDFPKGGPAVEEFMGMGGMYQHIISDAPNPEMARELILSFFPEERMQEMFATGVSYTLPAYEPQWDWEIITQYAINEPMRGAALHPTAWNGAAWPGPYTAQIGAMEAGNIHTDMIANVINGQMTAAESVADAHTKTVQIFQEFGVEGA